MPTSSAHDQLMTPSDRVSPETVEKLSIAEITAALSVYELDEQSALIDTMLKSKDSKWRASSGMQKAIRRGDAHTAKRAAHALWMCEEEVLWRRLMVTAVEDVGIADPVLSARVMAIAGKKKLRQGLGEKKLLFWLIDLLADAVKDRAAPELTALVDHSVPLKKSHLGDLVTATEIKLLNLACQGGSIELRMAALWMLAGTARWESKLLPVVKGFPVQLETVLNSLELPPALRYVMEKYASRHRDAMWLALPIVWRFAEPQSPLVQTNTLPSVPTVKGLPAYAYDWHTQDGRRAFAYFAKMVPELQMFGQAYPDAALVQAIGYATFFLEGGLLAKELTWPGRSDLYAGAQWYEFHAIGVPKPEVMENLLKIVGANLDKLHYARSKVVA